MNSKEFEALTKRMEPRVDKLFDELREHKCAAVIVLIAEDADKKGVHTSILAQDDNFIMIAAESLDELAKRNVEDELADSAEGRLH